MDHPERMPGDAAGPADRPSPAWKVRTAIRIWAAYARVRRVRRERPLRDVVATLSAPADRAVVPVPVDRLSRAVSRTLNVGPWRLRCLDRALVLYHLVRLQGTSAELVIGIRPATSSTDAHAWVEIDGRDVGPAPGRFGHDELVRYPGAEASTGVDRAS